METVAHFIDTFVPDNYNLFLDIDRKAKQFEGKVLIKGEALQTTISLHQKDLQIKTVSLAGKSLSFEVDNAQEALHINLPELGEILLEVHFSGYITDNMTGMYPSYYVIDGQKKEIISTQFESHFAREVFPSVDEPEAKATFDLSIRFDQEEGDVVLANMPEMDVDKRKATGIWTFATSPRMSSYLLAFAIGELHGKTAKTKNGTEVVVFASKVHPLSSFDFALDISVRVIDFYEEYFGIAYPIPQAYQVGLPDFSSGAMENWGLITYREIYLLVDENSTFSSRQQVALVIAHEIAHQWFGNLVTMKWWDDLWLNESFANMMEYLAIDTIEPNWKIMEDFQTSGIPLALTRDATDGVQSVHVAVNHPDEINTLFDPAIVYAKGSRLMHMLRRWLGDNDFSKGLTTYFQKHQYENTVGTDLWQALSEQSGKDVASFMESWLEQPGYPVVSVSVKEDTLILKQKQFFIGQHQDQARLWEIPLNSNWEGLPDTLKEGELYLKDYQQLRLQNSQPLRFNTENTAHYILDYDKELLNAILNDWEQLDTTTKLQILQDRRLLAEAGLISYAELVNLIAKLSNEHSHLVTTAIASITGSLKKFFEEGSQAEERFKKLVLSLFEQNYHQLGFEGSEGETDEEELVRQTSLHHLTYVGYQPVREKAQSFYEQYQENLEKLPAAIRGLVLTNQLKSKENPELIDRYLQDYRNTTDSNYRRQIAAAIAKTKSTTTVDTVLKHLKDKDYVKPQDLSMWYAFLLGESFTQERAWEWAKQEWDWILSTLGGDMSFDKFVIYPASVFKTRKMLEEYQAFFEPQLDNKAIHRTIVMGIREIEARVALVESESGRVQEVVNTLFA